MNRFLKFKLPFYFYSIFASFALFADHLPHSAHLNHAERQGVDRFFYEMKPVSKEYELLNLEANKKNPVLIKAADTFINQGTRYAVLILNDNKIEYEEYRNGGSPEKFFLSNSIAKSMLALAVGEAFCAGKINSLDDFAENYHPSLTNTAQGKSTIRNLLRMSSGAAAFPNMDIGGGLNWSDYMDLANGRVSLIDYIHRDNRQRPELKGYNSSNANYFMYNGRDSSSLALVIEGATGVKFQEWFENTVWSKSGAASTGFWQLTSDNRAVVEAVVLMTAQDYLRISLYILKSLADTNNVCISQFFRESLSRQIATDRPEGDYGYHFWVRKTGMPFMLGYGGQILALNPDKNRAILILSQKMDDDKLWDFVDKWYHSD